MSDPYITVAEADAYAAAELDSTVWDALTDGQKLAALVQASDAIDALRWQGRKYAADQEREFPRIVNERPSTLEHGTGVEGGDAVIWDDDANVAAVPEAVKKATYLQAVSIAEGVRDIRADDRHDGVTSHGAAGASETFDAARPMPGLCRRAHEITKRYRLRWGRLV